jgi:ATP synthase in type III secretion protein N
MAERNPAGALDLGQALARLESAAPRRESGRVTEVTGLVVRASVPGVRVGEIVKLEGSGLEAEVVGFRGDEAVLMPLGEAAGIGPDSLVSATGRPLAIGVSDGVLGRVLDGLGRPIDGGGPIAGAIPWALPFVGPLPSD